MSNEKAKTLVLKEIVGFLRRDDGVFPMGSCLEAKVKEAEHWLSLDIEYCPFCGSAAAVNSPCSDTDYSPFVECQYRDCKGRGPVRRTDEEAVAAWNGWVEDE